MILKFLSLKDFLSHADTKIDFRPDSKVLISGPSGEGKSSILEAITWCLFGIGRSENRNLVRNGEKKAIVELSFILNDPDGVWGWTITRSVNTKGTQTLDINAFDGNDIPATSLKEKQAFIEKEITRCGYDLFINGPYWPQATSESFVSLPALRRKELLLQIIGSGDIDEYDAKAKQWVAESEVRISEIDTEIRVGETSMETDKNTVDAFAANTTFNEEKMTEEMDKLKFNISEDEKNMPLWEADVRKLRERLMEADTRRAERAALIAGMPVPKSEEVIKAMNEEIASLSSTATSMVELREKVKKMELERSEIEKNAKRITQLEASKPTARLFDARKQLEQAVLALGILDSNPDNLCPATGKTCPKAQALIDKRRRELQFDISAASILITGNEKMLADIEAELATIPNREFDEKAYQEAGESLVKEVQVNSRLAVLRNALEIVNSDKEKAERIVKALAEKPEIATPDTASEILLAETHLKELTSRLTSSKVALESQKANYKIWQLLSEQAAAAQKRLDEFGVSREKLSTERNNLTLKVADVKTLREAFGANGIKAVIVDTILPRLESKANEVLSELCDLRLLLDTQKEKTSGEGVKEGLWITIRNGQGEEIPFENLSGGEKLKVSVAVTEALADLQNCQFRLLDETVVGLDAESVGQFTEILMRLQVKFPQVIAISHLPEVQAIFPDRIEISKVGGISYAR